MPWSALPEHLNTPAKWAGTDDSRVAWMNWRLKVKGWFAYSPRATQWWARWDTPPKCLFKIGGAGKWRYEADPFTILLYLSRIQYWKKWHVQVQWPFFIACNFYIKGQLWYAYIGCSYDQDGVYWFPAAFIGRTWK